MSPGAEINTNLTIYGKIEGGINFEITNMRKFNLMNSYYIDTVYTKNAQEK